MKAITFRNTGLAIFLLGFLLSVASIIPTNAFGAQSLSSACRSLLKVKKLTKKQSDTLFTKCLPMGGSAGVSRGDFNGDGFADLAIGAPQEAEIINGANVRAGAVTVIYGAENGLKAEAASANQASQFWFPGQAGVPISPGNDDQFGAALASGEFNGDRFSDLAIGIPGKDINGLSNTGAVVVLYGTAAGLSSAGAQSWTLADFTEIAKDASTLMRADERLGSALAWGDFDADGFGDLAIGIPGKTFKVFNRTGFMPIDGLRLDKAGAILVLRGSRGGLTATQAQFRTQPTVGIETSTTLSDGAVVTRLSLAESGDEFGASLTGGDYNGDGFGDLVIGVPKEDLGSLADAGAVNVIYGSKTGLRQDDAGIQFWNRGNINPGRQIFARERPGTGDQFGLSLASGDLVTGSAAVDNVADLVVGLPFDDLEPIQGRESIDPILRDSGSVILLRGIRDLGFVQGSNQTFGNDWSGDIYQSLYFDVAERSEPKDFFGLSIGVGDFDRNGKADLAVGAPGEDIGEIVDAGIVQIFYQDDLGFDPFHSPRQQIWHMGNLTAAGGLQANTRFGSSLSSWNFGRNFDGQRYADLAIGSPFLPVIQSGRTVFNAGGVFTLYGTKVGLTDARDNPSDLWIQGNNGVPNQPELGDLFGMALY
jgi:hypothetical protein